MARQPPRQRRAESDDQRQRNDAVTQRYGDRPRIARGEVKGAPLRGGRQSDEGASDEEQGERAGQRRQARARQAVSRRNVNKRIHTASNLVNPERWKKQHTAPLLNRRS